MPALQRDAACAVLAVRSHRPLSAIPPTQASAGAEVRLNCRLVLGLNLSKLRFGPYKKQIPDSAPKGLALVVLSLKSLCLPPSFPSLFLYSVVSVVGIAFFLKTHSFLVLRSCRAHPAGRALTGAWLLPGPEGSQVNSAVKFFSPFFTVCVWGGGHGNKGH